MNTLRYDLSLLLADNSKEFTALSEKCVKQITISDSSPTKFKLNQIFAKAPNLNTADKCVRLTADKGIENTKHSTAEAHYVESCDNLRDFRVTRKRLGNEENSTAPTSLVL